MESFQEGFSSFITGFSIVFLVAVVVWMVGLVVLLFRELFSPVRFELRTYIHKVFRMLLSSLEWTFYGFVIVGPILMFMTKNYMTYGMITIAAVILSAISLYIRSQTGGFGGKSFRFRKEK
ncbi:hypothetical protein [Thermoactinomyces mirandus]|uniref:Uncharacterized protein n=1 Tax=Thermoactinomyces mirandus TaxID=2756294 RepID=A0A7W1XQM6_9BACL|nr:hypothetical protein [Thermoactinomyces mirandus]MBA4601346.1 hypothetical protein [Thermoactinomyces mirandus]